MNELVSGLRGRFRFIGFPLKLEVEPAPRLERLRYLSEKECAKRRQPDFYQISIFDPGMGCNGCSTDAWVRP